MTPHIGQASLETTQRRAVVAEAECEQLRNQLADALVALAYAEADRDRLQEKLTAESGYCGELLIQRDRLADTLREIVAAEEDDRDGDILSEILVERMCALARAALDRHTKAEA